MRYSVKYLNNSKVKQFWKQLFKFILKIVKPIESWLWKIELFRKPLQVAFNCLAPDDWILVEISGIKIYINMRSGAVAKSIIQKGIYERGTTKLFIKNTKKGAIFVDIGAYCGYYSLIAAKLVGEEGKVFAFEPHPDNYKMLIRTISFNKLNNIVPINKAVSDKTGKTKLFLDTCGQHTIIYNNVLRKKYLEVETINLDRFFEENKISPDIIKMDIEGAELLALKGMQRTLKESKNLKLFIELTHNEQKVKTFLVEKGFKYFFIKNNGTLISETSTPTKNELEPNIFAEKIKYSI